MAVIIPHAGPVILNDASNMYYCSLDQNGLCLWVAELLKFKVGVGRKSRSEDTFPHGHKHEKAAL